MTEEDKYVFLRMYNGDQLMATKLFENNEVITIEFPMIIRMFPRLESTGLVEQITSGPYCQFTEDKVFTFQKKDILFSKKLHEVMIPHYERMIHEHETEVDVDEKQAAEGNLETDETVENIAKAVDQLHNIFERARKRRELREEEEIPFTVVPGNETKH